MAQTIQLVPGNAAATSDDILVVSGAQAIIGIYTESGTPLSDAGESFRAEVLLLTPGEPHWVGTLDAAQPSLQVNSPGTYRVKRNAAKVNVGVFSEI